jgi:hypothetical protein
MSDDRSSEHRVRGAFAEMIGTTPAYGDPVGGVHQRVGRLRRRRTIVATAAATVVLAGAATAAYDITRPASHQPTEVTTEVVAIDPHLSLHVDATAAAAVGSDEQVSVVLTGTGESADVYGWRVAWGDGGLDRVFGSDNCRSTPLTSLRVTRVFVHHYVKPGPQRIIVELTRCGVVQARTITHITVTQGH